MGKFGIKVFFLFIIILLLFSINANSKKANSLNDPKKSSNNILSNFSSNLTGFNGTNHFEPIRFWRADPSLFPISDARIFPIASLGADNSLSNLGMAWITWTVKIGQKYLAIYAIYNRGHINQFTTINGLFDQVYWFGFQQNLFLITSDASSNTTIFHLYDLTGETHKFSFNFYSTHPQIYLSPVNSQSNLEVFYYKNGITPSIIKINQFQYSEETTHDVILSSLPTSALYSNQTNLIFERSDNNYTLPNYFTNQSIVGHYLLTPEIFDIGSKKIWIDGNIFDMPKNSTAVHTWGIQSSIIQTSNNSFYEFDLNNTKWDLIAKFNSIYNITDISIVDIQLYLAPTILNGLDLSAYGKDEDKDFAPDTLESYYGCSPTKIDTDGDGIPDGLEIAFGTDPTKADANLDYDKDGLTNVQEFNLGLDPLNKDSDFGGALDGWEVKYHFNPLNRTDDTLDPDKDGLTNAQESIWNTNPFLKDTDHDGMPDNWEVKYHLNPLNPTDAQKDPDHDGYTNLQEYRMGTDPLIPNPHPIFDSIWIWFGIDILLMLFPTYLLYKKISNNI